MGFTRLGLSRADAEALIVRSVLLAREVRDELAGDGVERWVAASVGPYGAALADGSEYRGRYGVTAAWLRAFHRPRLELLAVCRSGSRCRGDDPGCRRGRRCSVDLLDEIGLPAWFSYSAANASRPGPASRWTRPSVVAASARSGCCCRRELLRPRRRGAGCAAGR